jgi:hypothetical protein
MSKLGLLARRLACLAALVLLPSCASESPNARDIAECGSSAHDEADATSEGPDAALAPAPGRDAGADAGIAGVDAAATSPDVGPTVPDAGPPPRGVSAKGTDFTFDGKVGRFIGVNIAGLVHYGANTALPYAGLGDQEAQLSSAAAMGAGVARVFLPEETSSASVMAARLKSTLAVARKNNIRLIVVFIDYYKNRYHPPGDASAYGTDQNGYTVLLPPWFSGGYRTNYLPYVLSIVPNFIGDPAIFAWELGNEIKNPPDPASFHAFVADAAAKIKAADPSHLVAVGMISAKNGGLSEAQREALYRIPAVGFLTTHNYEGGDDDDEAPLAAKVGKPLLIEETGFPASRGDRGPLVRIDITRRMALGARGYMQWGFMATGFDIGDGDRNVGMDRVFHSDWQSLFDVYKAAAGSLGALPPLGPWPPPAGGGSP